MQILRNGNRRLKKKMFVRILQNQQLVLKMVNELITIVIVVDTLVVNHVGSSVLKAKEVIR